MRKELNMTTITILKSEILNEVEKRSSLEGLVQPEKFDILWASTEVVELLESYWIEGYTAVVQLLKRYLSNSTIAYKLTTVDQSEALEISVEMPSRYSSLLDGSVTNDIKMLLACNMLTGWLNVISPEVSAKYDVEAKGYAEDLRVKLLFRVDPVNEFTAARDDEDAFTDGVDLSEAKKDTEGFAEEASLKTASSDSASFVSEVSLSSAKSDTEGFVEGTGLSQAKTDDEEFVSESGLSKAKSDTEGFGVADNLSSARSDTEGFVKEADLNPADTDTESMAKEEVIGAAKEDSAEFVKEESLSAAKTDTEGFVEGGDISKAKLDTEGFLKGTNISSAKTDMEGFVDEAGLSQAKADTESLQQYRRCCEYTVFRTNI